MLDRQSCERRVYRLATLLTGDPARAARVIQSVVDAQPDLRRLDSPHLDRLTVLRSREIRSRQLPPSAGDKTATNGLAKLGRQQREAWVFHFVYRMMPRDMAKAMDCSVRAIQAHLTSAESVMTTVTADQAATGREFLKYTLRLDVPGIHRRQQAQRRRWRLVRRLVVPIVIISVLGLIGALLWTSGWLDDLIGTSSTEEQSPAIDEAH